MAIERLRMVVMVVVVSFLGRVCCNSTGLTGGDAAAHLLSHGFDPTEHLDAGELRVAAGIPVAGEPETDADAGIANPLRPFGSAGQFLLHDHEGDRFLVEGET